MSMDQTPRMAYDVHIGRPDTPGGMAVPITAEEWIDFMRSSGDFEIERIESKWGGYPPAEDVRPDEFSWSGGMVFVERPSDLALARCGQIARHFGAQAVGDDGAIWNEHGEVAGHAWPQDDEGRQRAPGPASVDRPAPAQVGVKAPRRYLAASRRARP
jgi:hypothetical protein